MAAAGWTRQSIAIAGERTKRPSRWPAARTPSRTSRGCPIQLELRYAQVRHVPLPPREQPRRLRILANRLCADAEGGTPRGALTLGRNPAAGFGPVSAIDKVSAVMRHSHANGRPRDQVAVRAAIVRLNHGLSHFGR